MNGQGGGLQSFRKALYAAVACSLRERHPAYVKAFTETLNRSRDFKQALETATSFPTDAGFAKWRPLLTAEFDLGLAMDQLRMSLKLLGSIPPRDSASEQGVLESDGAWIYYHYNVCVLCIDGLLERTKKLLKQTVRALVKPTKPNWKAFEQGLLSTVVLLSDDIRKVRNPIAHGGGVVQAPAKERIWEGIVLLPDAGDRGVPLEQIYEPFVQYRQRWHGLLESASATVLAEIDKVLEQLNSEIVW